MVILLKWIALEVADDIITKKQNTSIPEMVTLKKNYR